MSVFEIARINIIDNEFLKSVSIITQKETKIADSVLLIFYDVKHWLSPVAPICAEL